MNPISDFLANHADDMPALLLASAVILGVYLPVLYILAKGGVLVRRLMDGRE